MRNPRRCRGRERGLIDRGWSARRALSRTCLALHEHGGVAGRDLRDHPKQPSHELALPDEPLESVGGPKLDRNLLWLGIDLHAHAAEQDDAPGVETGLSHAQAVDEGAVSASEVADPELSILQDELGVEARDGGIRGRVPGTTPPSRVAESYAHGCHVDPTTSRAQRSARSNAKAPAA